MRNSNVVQAIAGLVTVGALTTLYLSAYELPPRFEAEPHEAVGWVMAREALSLVRGDSPILVITRDTSLFKQPALERQLTSFLKVIRKARNQAPVVEALQVDPLRPVEVPAGDFLEYLRKSPPGSVIVSFMGPPLLTEEQLHRLKEIKPKVVAFCTGNLPAPSHLKTLFKQGLLHAAVIRRPAMIPSPAKPRSLQEWFDRSYVLLNTTNRATFSRSKNEFGMNLEKAVETTEYTEYTEKELRTTQNPLCEWMTASLIGAHLDNIKHVGGGDGSQVRKPAIRQVGKPALRWDRRIAPSRVANRPFSVPLSLKIFAHCQDFYGLTLQGFNASTLWLRLGRSVYSVVCFAGFRMMDRL